MFCCISLRSIEFAFILNCSEDGNGEAQGSPSSTEGTNNIMEQAAHGSSSSSSNAFKTAKKAEIPCEHENFDDDDDTTTTTTTSSFLRLAEMGLMWEYLPWTDAMHLGSTCRALRTCYTDHEPHVLGPLLTHLEDMVGSHRSRYCFHVLAPLCACTCSSAQSRLQRPTLAALDPRYRPSYRRGMATTTTTTMSCRPQQTNGRKHRCVAMIAFISKIVSNMQSQFDCDNLSDPSKLPFTFGTLQEWEYLWTREDDHSMERIMKRIPRRLTFALNLASLAFGADALAVGGHGALDGALLGTGGSNYLSPSGSEFGVGASSILVETVESMFPFRDADFAAFLKERIHPSARTLDALGPTLSSRLLLCSPKGRRIVLPDDLEPELDLCGDDSGNGKALREGVRPTLTLTVGEEANEIII
jgi:hypothetical protein